jgi:hypothetical protein
MNDWQKFGLILVLLGIVLPFMGVRLPGFATVIWEQSSVEIYPSMPSGSSSSPTVLLPGSTVTISATIWHNNPEGLITPTDCKVQITGVGFSYDTGWITLTPKYEGDDYNANDVLIRYYWSMSGSWTVPQLSEGQKLKFYWTATIGSHSNVAESYAVIYVVDGYFEVGSDVDPYVRADQSSVIKVLSGNLKFRFTATSHGEMIDPSNGVFVQITPQGTVNQKTVALKKDASGAWTGTYTLPARGTYTVTGWFNVGDRQFQKMSLLIPGFGGGAEAPAAQQMLNLVTVAGGIVFLAGTLTGKKGRR